MCLVKKFCSAKFAHCVHVKADDEVGIEGNDGCEVVVEIVLLVLQSVVGHIFEFHFVVLVFEYRGAV